MASISSSPATTRSNCSAGKMAAVREAPTDADFGESIADYDGLRGDRLILVPIVLLN